MGELMKTPEGLRRLADADERVTRHADGEQDQVPPVHGGEGVEVVQDAPDLRFEPLEPAERREEAADEVTADVPAPPSPASARYDNEGRPARYDNGREIPRCVDGQEVPGMEVDLVEQLVTAPPVDGVRSAVLCPATLDGVIGGQPQPHPQRGTMPGGVGEEVDVPLQEMMKLWDQSTVEEAKELDKQILSIVGSLVGSTSKYRREEDVPSGPSSARFIRRLESVPLPSYAPALVSCLALP